MKAKIQEKTVVDLIRRANPVQLKFVQERLKKAAEKSGIAAELPAWQEAIDHLHDKPELVLRCNSILRIMIEDGLHDAGVTDQEGLWWCNTHQREATHTDGRGFRRCDPNLGGIMAPCNVVFAQMNTEKTP